jgi:hypothetical protein
MTDWKKLNLVVAATAVTLAMCGCTTSPLANNSGVLPIGKDVYTLTAVNAAASSAKQDAIKIATEYCAKSNKSLEVNSLSSSSDVWGWHSADATFRCQ